MLWNRIEVFYLSKKKLLLTDTNIVTADQNNPILTDGDIVTDQSKPILI